MGCDHEHQEPASRYDHTVGRLTWDLVCTLCGTVVEVAVRELDYRPDPIPPDRACVPAS